MVVFLGGKNEGISTIAPSPFQLKDHHTQPAGNSRPPNHQQRWLKGEGVGGRRKKERTGMTTNPAGVGPRISHQFLLLFAQS